MTVFGQDDAVTQMVSAIKLLRQACAAVINNWIFLLAGPTEWARPSSPASLRYKWVWSYCVLICPSTWAYTVSQLIGAPQAVGFDQGGLLTDAVTKHPHSVVLLDS